jgi:tetratricopeptide (TPR) repeat protein
MKDLIQGFQRAEGLSPKFVKRMEEIKKMARKGPYQAPSTPGPAFTLSVTNGFRDTIKQGAALYKQGKYLEAKNTFDGVVSILSPNKSLSEDDTEILSDAYYHLGLCYEKLNNSTDALNSFSRAIELSPYDADPYYHRATVYSQMNQYSPALNDLSSAIRHNPDYVEAYFDRANINFLNGKFKETLADCEKGLAIEPASPYFYVLRAMTCELLGRYKEAISDCTAALKDFTDDAQSQVMLYSIRGRAFGLLKEYDKAVSDFSRLVRLIPENVNGYYYRGLVLAGKGELNKALADFRKALELKPGNPEIADSLFQAEQELSGKQMQEKLKKKEKELSAKYSKENDYEAELNQLKGEIKTIKELLIEIIRPKPEYSIPLPKPETGLPDSSPTMPFWRGPGQAGIFRIPIRPTIIMPVPDKSNGR